MHDSEETQTPEEEEIQEPQEEQEEPEAEAVETTPQSEEKKEDPKPAKPANEIKVVIIMKADNIMLGVQSPDCDPVYKTMKGDLTAALQLVPTLVAEAKLKWETSKRYPKANLPEPPPAPKPARPPAAASPPKTKAQPSFF